jgi:outer membrane receptor protein involved in Fe transport
MRRLADRQMHGIAGIRILQRTRPIVFWLVRIVWVALLLPRESARPQSAGVIQGVVTRRDSGIPLAGVTVRVDGTGLGGSTTSDGRYTITGVPTGPHTITFRWIGYEPVTQPVTVAAGSVAKVDAALTDIPLRLSDVIVEAASRVPERIVKAPAAISVVPQYQVAAAAATNQLPAVLRSVPGFDAVQTGMNDFNINARGFNSALNRRVLVLQDGRDLSFVLVGAQEWSALAGSLDEMGRIEVVRGPGSALYGANAFNGVVNITTPPARDVIGTKWNVSGGEIATLRTDARHARLFGDGRFAYKLTAGYNRSDTYTRSRTRFDSTDIVREYADATDSAVAKARAEMKPLKGQTVDAATGAALGDRDPITTAYGVGRLDYYSPRGSVGTVEGGMSETENELFVTTIGRVQVTRALRPYARVNWGAPGYYVMGYYSGRRTPDPQIALSSGASLLETSSRFHLEAQFNRAFASTRGRLIAGGSVRTQLLDTKATLLAAEQDDRTDHLYATFGQLEYTLSERMKTVLGARLDGSNLYKTEISPKAAIVYNPGRAHSIRATVNRAFQPPSPSEHFLHVAAGAPTPSPLGFERGIEAYFAAVTNALIAAGAGSQVAALNLPADVPFGFAAVTPVLALGNEDLKPQTVTGYELGYRGELSRNGYLTIDLFLNEKRDFVTALLPGVNSNYPRLFTTGGVDLLGNLDAITALVNSLSIPAANKAALLASQPALRGGYNALVNLATTLPDGSRALVLSYANAGRVEERGVELGAGIQLTDHLRIDGSFSHFAFEIKRATIPGDRLVPNTPANKGTISFAYTGYGRFDFGANARFVEGYHWLAGVFDGFVPAAQIINANAGYQLGNNLRAQLVATNLFDQKRFEMYGGSVNGRRILAGVTATF